MPKSVTTFVSLVNKIHPQDQHMSWFIYCWPLGCCRFLWLCFWKIQTLLGFLFFWFVFGSRAPNWSSVQEKCTCCLLGTYLIISSFDPALNLYDIKYVDIPVHTLSVKVNGNLNDTANRYLSTVSVWPFPVSTWQCPRTQINSFPSLVEKNFQWDIHPKN